MQVHYCRVQEHDTATDIVSAHQLDIDLFVLILCTLSWGNSNKFWAKGKASAAVSYHADLLTLGLVCISSTNLYNGTRFLCDHRLLTIF